MPDAPTKVMVTIARDPALVRTARLVAAAVARRAGRDDEFVEEVRLAVGEACAVLLAQPTADGNDHVTIAMQVADRFVVDVSSAAAPPQAEPVAPSGWTEPWALLRGLIDDFRVHTDGSTTRVSMSWPAA